MARVEGSVTKSIPQAARQALLLILNLSVRGQKESLTLMPQSLPTVKLYTYQHLVETVVVVLANLEVWYKFISYFFSIR
jgi:hypothetical protein